MTLFESLLGCDEPNRPPWRSGRCQNPFDAIRSLSWGLLPDELRGIDLEGVSPEFGSSVEKSLAWLVELDCARLGVAELYAAVLGLADWFATARPADGPESWQKTLLVLLPLGDFDSGLSADDLQFRMRIELMAAGLIMYRVGDQLLDSRELRPLFVLRKVDQHDLHRLRTRSGTYCREQLRQYLRRFAGDLSGSVIEEMALAIARGSEKISCGSVSETKIA
jgi:hypothetical protein